MAITPDNLLAKESAAIEWSRKKETSYKYGLKRMMETNLRENGYTWNDLRHIYELPEVDSYH